MRGYPAPNPLHDSWVGGGGRPAGRRCLQQQAPRAALLPAPRVFSLPDGTFIVWKA